MRDYNSAQSRPKKKKNLRNRDIKKLAFVSLIKKSLLIFALLLVITLVLTKVFVSNFFSLEGSLNLVFASNNLNNKNAVYLVKFIPDREEIEIKEMSGDIQVSLVGGYGSYRLQAIYPLLKLEGRDDDFIKSVYSLALETVVDEVVIIDNNFEISKKADLFHLLSKAVVQKLEKKQFSTAFLNLLMFSIRPSSKLLLTQINEKSEMIDSSMDSISDDCPIAVVNTTETTGLANKVADVLEDNGFLVVRTTNDFNKLDKTKIYFDENMSKCNQTLIEVSKIIPNSENNEANGEMANQYRAGIVIMLGKDVDSN
jgi:hypothetical protein